MQISEIILKTTAVGKFIGTSMITKKTIILSLFVLAKFGLQYLIVDQGYELHRDEFLHLDQANHLAWGYVSVPPVTSWISCLIQFFGNTIFWIRFFPALFGALTIVVVWKIIETLNGNLFALVLGSACILFSALLRLNILYQPGSLDILCWGMFYFVLIRYTKTENSNWLYLLAVVFAIGFLNKYNIVFLLIGLIPALLLTKRSIFREKHLYFSLIVCLLIISPNLEWQRHNNFPVFRHLEQLANTQLVNVNRWHFLRDQLLFFIGSLFVIISGLYGLLIYPPFKRYRFFFWTFGFTVCVFVFLRAKGYYAIGLYPVYIAFGSVYLEKLWNTGRKRHLQPLAIAVPILTFIPMYHSTFPNKNPKLMIDNLHVYKDLGLHRWEDGKDHYLPQDFADMLGWKELANKIDSIYPTISRQGHTIILCDNYGQAGAINYYAKNRNIQAVSFSADYINWFVWDKAFVNMIRVKTFGSEGNELNETGPIFNTSYQAGFIQSPFAREHGTTIYVFLKCKVDINNRIKEEIANETYFH